MSENELKAAGLKLAIDEAERMLDLATRLDYKEAYAFFDKIKRSK